MPVAHQAHSIIRTNAPWGLQRISQSARLANQNPNTLSFTYTFDPSAGQGVDIFIVGMFEGVCVLMQTYANRHPRHWHLHRPRE